jgi:SAM-dependent methyltransferase
MTEFEDRSVKAYNADFAYYYDIITRHKDYTIEVDALDELLTGNKVTKDSTILDLGCGTGNHACELAERGYQVFGIDTSEEMISVALNKQTTASFKHARIDELSESDFSFCYSLYNVINCLENLDELINFFKATHDRLRLRGVLIVECWNPIAVIRTPPEYVERVYESEECDIQRTCTPNWDFMAMKLQLAYDVRVHDKDKNENLKFASTHKLTLFTPTEVEYALKLAGFVNIRMKAALPKLGVADQDSRMLSFTCNRALR